MKLKPIFIYIFILIAGVIALIIFTGRGSNPSAPVISGNNSDKQIPAPPPSKDNVSESFKHELSSLQTEVEQHPNDTLSLRQYADLLAESHKPMDAVTYYERILKKYPRRTDILFSLSFIYFNKGDFANAEDVTNKILLYDKNNLQAMYNLGAIDASKGDFAKAKLIWTKLINENPASDLAATARESLNKLK